MLRILATTLFALAGATAAHADVYRWVDSNGTVQYSDRWVPGSVLVKTDKSKPSGTAPSSETPAPTAPATNTPPAVSRADQILAQERDQRTVNADVAKVREEQCKKAREAYDSAVQRPRMYTETKDGQRAYLSDEEINAHRVELLNKRREYCGS